MPHMLQFAQARQRMYSPGTDEEMNVRIIAEVLKALHKKMQIKLICSNNDYCFFRLTEAEGITLYKFLMDYPIQQGKDFELQQRDALVHLLHKYFSDPVPSSKIIQLYR